MIFVTVGSRNYPFDRLFKKLDELYEKGVLTDPMFAQIGTSTYKPKNYEYKDFISPDEFNENISKADIVVSQSAKSAGLLPLSRLRTGRERFHSSGSSISSRFRAAFQENLLAMLMDVCHIAHFVLAAHRFRRLEENFPLVADFHGKSTVIAAPVLVLPDLLKASG